MSEKWEAERLKQVVAQGLTLLLRQMYKKDEKIPNVSPAMITRKRVQQ
jgi:hypothetical protein